MRSSQLVSFFSLAFLLLTSSAPAAPLTPAEAAKKVNEKVVVRIEVKSTGGRENRYLNSEADYKDGKNFTIFISKEDLEKFKKVGIEKPEAHFNGKTIDVTGTVVLDKEKPRINVDDPSQIKIVPKIDE